MTAIDQKTPGDLSRLLEEFAHISRRDLPDEFLPGLAPGTAVGRFVVDAEIGRGGFGVVYSATDPELGRSVALKLLRPGSRLSQMDQEWLRREAEAVARLNHPNIVTIFDFGRAAGGAYLVFELLKGETLGQRIARGGITPVEAVRIALSVARGLEHAHRADVLHRDLKPANVHLGEDGSVKVLDFGIAHLFGQVGPSSGGTPAYMAPEQWREESGDARTDLFALGVLLYQMLTATLPYGTPSTPGDPSTRPPPKTIPASKGSRDLRRLVDAMTSLDPAARPATAAEVARRLSRALDRLEGRRRPIVVAGTVAALAVAALAGVLFLRQPEPPAGEQVGAVLVDAVNETGQPDLDSLAELLRVNLSESPRLRLVPRERALRTGARVGAEAEVGTGPAEHLTMEAARRAARADGAEWLLALTVRKAGAGAGLRLRLEATPAKPGPAPFAEEASAADLAGVAPAVDDLAGAVRKRLRERRDDRAAHPARAAQLATSQVAAFAEYERGLGCLSAEATRSGSLGPSSCRGRFERAVAADPGFALAHYELAVILGVSHEDDVASQAHLAAAVSALDRLGHLDAALVRAWQARQAGHSSEALAQYDLVLKARPDDRHTLALAANLPFQSGRWATTLPYLRRLADLAPGDVAAQEDLAEALAALDQRDELSALRDRVRALPFSATRGSLEVRLAIWLGDPDAAVALAEQGVAAGGGAAAESNLALALNAAGQFGRVEPLLRARLARAPDVGAMFAMTAVLLARGRHREALRFAEGLALHPGGLTTAEVTFQRATAAACAGRTEAARFEVEKLARQDALYFSIADVLLALGGDVEVAGRLAAGLERDAPGTREVAALSAWRRGDGPAAVAELEQLEQSDPTPFTALPPSYLLAEVNGSLRRHADALAAVERFHRTLPRGAWRGWGWTRSTVIAARARLALGDLAGARRDLSRAQAALAPADPDLPLLAEARALERSLAAAAR